MTYPEYRQYIYYGTEDKSFDYWLASPCVSAEHNIGRVDFHVRIVSSTAVTANQWRLFDSRVR